MKPPASSFNFLLRSAVLAALPLVGCAAPPPPQPEPPPPTDSNQCFKPPIVKQEQASINQVLTERITNTSYANCVALCEQAVRQQQRMSFVPIALKDFNTSSCSISNSQPQRLSCETTYTSEQAVFTGNPGCPVPGRTPAGLQTSQAEAHSVLGRYFADMTAMESAAVTAFRYLVRELQAYQAPAELIQAAEAAIAEEIQHAKLAGLLAKAHDAIIPKVVVDDFQLRSLFEIALENAVEGCINETFAAACGLWQQHQAKDELFRTVITHITDDECRHAELSWAIHAWAMPQLTAAQQAHIRQAQLEAIAELEHSFQQTLQAVATRQALGLPDATEAQRLLIQLKQTVWA